MHIEIKHDLILLGLNYFKGPFSYIIHVNKAIFLQDLKSKTKLFNILHIHEVHLICPFCFQTNKVIHVFEAFIYIAFMSYKHSYAIERIMQVELSANMISLFHFSFTKGNNNNLLPNIKFYYGDICFFPIIFSW